MTPRARAAAALAAAYDSTAPWEAELIDAYRLQLGLIVETMAHRLETLTASADWTPPDGDELLDTTAAAASIRAATDGARASMVDSVASGIVSAYGATYDPSNALLAQVLATLGQNITSITEDERDRILAAIQAAQASGLSAINAASLIRSQFAGASTSRSLLIARTERRGASNGASWAAVMMLDAEALAAGEDAPFPYKKWLATHDGRTRHDHAVADGQIVPIAAPFIVGGSPMLYPGDQQAPAGEVCNCRCTQTYPDGITASAGFPFVTAVPRGGIHWLTTEAPVPRIPAYLTASVAVAAGARWAAILAPLDVATDDGRMLDSTGYTSRAMPLTLMGMTENPEFGGHAGAQVAGRIDTSTIVGSQLQGTGVFDTGEFGAEMERLVRDEMVNGVSVDLAISAYEMRRPDGSVVDPESDEAWFSDDLLFVATQWKLLAATVCPMPAFEGASISLLASATPLPVWRLQGRLTALDGAPLTPKPDQAALTASAVPTVPPADWFAVDEPDEGCPLTVLPTGQVYGHVAVWGSCHTGHPQACVQPPSSPSEYAYFHLGEIATTDGTVSVGQITMSAGHADERLGATAARAHYDNTAAAVADIHVHDGEHGIWACGALRPGVTAEQVRELTAAKLSGDWRGQDGHLEMLAVLAVNVPGFSIPRTRSTVTASGDAVSLVAAGIVGEDSPVRVVEVSVEDARARVSALHASVVGEDVVLRQLAERAGVA